MSRADPTPSPSASDESPSHAVVAAVAAEEGVRPEAVEPVLYDVLDPDALDALFAPRHDGTRRGSGETSFVLGDYAVTVDADGSVDVVSHS